MRVGGRRKWRCAAAVLLLAAACAPDPLVAPAARPALVPVAGAATAAAAAPVAPMVTRGESHGCALRVDGVVVCWEANQYGQAPAQRSAKTGVFVQVSAGGAGSDHTCALRDDGRVECWGRSLNGEAPPFWLAAGGAKFTTIGTGPGHTCGVRADRAIECWGLNTDGQSPSSWTTTGGFTQVAVGRAHTCALTVGGQVLCRGRNDRHQAPPVVVASLAPRFVEVRASGDRTCALSSNQVAQCWGDVRGEETFHGYEDPPASGYARLSAGPRQGCGLHTNGRIGCWGDNTDHQAPDMRVAEVGQYVDLSIGGSLSCGLRDDGWVECWGRSASWSNPYPKQDARAPQSVGAVSGAPPATFGVGATFPVAAVATSGLPATFSSTTPSVCTASGGIVTVRGGGVCTVAADQAGGGGWLPASTSRDFALHLVTLAGLARVYDGQSKAVSATASPAFAMSLAYVGQPGAPSAPGSYDVRARILSTPSAPRYGGADGTLVIEMPRIAVQPARVSLSASAQVTVYVYGSAIVDAAAIVPASVRLRVAGGSATGAAVATRGGVYMTTVRDFDGDTRPDRQLVFLRGDLQAAGLAAGARTLVLEDHASGYRFEARASTPVDVVP